MFNVHHSSSCCRTSGLLHINDFFAVLKEWLIYLTLTLCYKLTFFYIDRLYHCSTTVLHDNGFYRAAWNADAVKRWEFCLSLRLSVRPSVTRVHCDKMVERSVQIYIPYKISFSLVYWEEKWLVGADPFYLKFWVNRPPLEQNRWFWIDNRS